MQGIPGCRDCQGGRGSRMWGHGNQSWFALGRDARNHRAWALRGCGSWCRGHGKRTRFAPGRFGGLGCTESRALALRCCGSFDVMLRKDHPVASLGCRGTFVEFGAKVFGRLVMAPRRFFLGSRMSRAWQASMVCSWRGWQFEMQGIAGRGPCGVAVRDGAGVASKRGLFLGDWWFGMQGTQGVGFAGLRLV